MDIESFWNEFLQSEKLDSTVRYADCFHFEVTEKLANELLTLVLSGKKRATSSSLFSYEAEKTSVPRAGDYSIVTDWDGRPRCVIQTVEVTILPFQDVTFEICKREGEDDTLATWQAGHRRFFQADGEALGYEFSENMPVVFEDFKVVFVK